MKFQLNVSQHQLVSEPGSVGILPAGMYHAKITGAKLDPTSAGTGTKLVVEYAIAVNGQSRKMTSMHNVANPNPTATQIGMAEVATIVAACNMPHINDTDELLGKTLNVNVILKFNANKQRDYNEINHWVAFGDIPENKVPGELVHTPEHIAAQANGGAAPAAASASWGNNQQSASASAAADWGQPSAPVQPAVQQPASPQPTATAAKMPWD